MTESSAIAGMRFLAVDGLTIVDGGIRADRLLVTPGPVAELFTDETERRRGPIRLPAATVVRPWSL
jgi:hypothetical protein